MKLIECKNWKALHIGARTILKSDMKLYPKATQDEILNVKVEPVGDNGHYKAI